MAVTAPRTSSPEPLSDLELEALLGAATWYAKYHEHMIAEQADDRSAMAVARRERFRALLAALRKHGVELRLPDGVSA